MAYGHIRALFDFRTITPEELLHLRVAYFQGAAYGFFRPIPRLTFRGPLRYFYFTENKPSGMHPDLAKTYDTIGNALEILLRHEEAQQYFKQAQHIRESLSS
ncbi:hypothetical protein RFF05_13085 [Bengtsoniella intestinalis]|uniref:hypothetical protein n=1 Tax=Bengtsoniella intestinalis TaxID=3073143 RepID=UPI00391F2F9F